MSGYHFRSMSGEWKDLRPDQEVDIAREPLLEQLRPALTACPVCGVLGWTVELEDGGTVTLHAERQTAAWEGYPIVNSACWTSE